jgi:pimeloyl-ACP methyl ester carboxylesterase
MKFELKELDGFKYVDEGQGEVLFLIHGLFGALSNWDDVINYFSKEFRVVIPYLPILELPVKKATIDGLVDFLENVIDKLGLNNLTLIGNSLGGHLALVYTLRHPENVKAIVLTGSSGLFENSMGGSYPRRGDRKYVEERVAYTFYDPKVATKELVDEVFEVTNNIRKSLNIVSVAKSAQRHNLANDIKVLKHPTLLIWGLNDTITPPSVAHEFNSLLKNSELRFIDKCGHAPMMERSEEFNKHLEEFLKLAVVT